jgi:hypothetical protein
MSGFAARYDMAVRNASFDFFTWATHVRLLGATSIVFGVKEFKSGKWSQKELRERYESIIKPGADLMGIPWEEGDGGITIGSHKLQAILELKNWDFPRIKSKLPARMERYTVTIRNVGPNGIKPFRNSHEAVWRAFAREIGAYVIEDYGVKAISLFDRMALYAGARMNFGVVNGPMGLLYFTPYPMMMFDCLNAEHAWKKHGIWPGQQIPWMLPGQSLVWEKPTIEVLRSEFAKLQ